MGSYNAVKVKVETVVPFAEAFAETRVLAHYVPMFKGREEEADDFSAARRLRPLIGSDYDSTDPRVTRYHLSLLEAVGVRGVVARWFGTRTGSRFERNLRATDALFEACGERGFAFAVCYDHRVVCADDKDALASRLRADFCYLRDAYFSRGRTYALDGDGAPIVLVLGNSETATDLSEWDAVLNDVFKTTRRPRLLLSTNGGEPPGTCGRFAWPPEAQRGAAMPLAAVAQFYEACYAEGAPGKHSGEQLVMGAVVSQYGRPRQEGSLARSSRRPSATSQTTGGGPEFDARALAMGFRAAAASGKAPPFLQLCSFNDFEHGAVLEPTTECNFDALLALQRQLVGRPDARVREELEVIFREARAFVGAPRSPPGDPNEKFGSGGGGDTLDDLPDITIAAIDFSSSPYSPK